MSQQDRIWSDFNLEKNCVHMTDENQVRLYLAQSALAVRCLARVVSNGAGTGNLEAKATDALVERLEATFRLLSLKHFYPSEDLPLKLDSTDSGFFHFSVLLDLVADKKARKSLLECIPKLGELKREMADVIIKNQGSVRPIQEQIAQRLYLEKLGSANLIEPFSEGALVSLGSEGGQHSGFWSFATYDRALNRPFIYLIYFGYDGKGPLQVDSADHRSLRREANRFATGAKSLLSFASNLDEALPHIRPSIVKRIIVGPYWAPGYTENEGELGTLLDTHREELPFALKWETETLISDREARVGKSLLSRGTLRQIFWLPRDMNLSRRGVSRLDRSVLVPHWLGQQLAEAEILADHHRFVIDKEDQVHAVH